MARPLSTRAIIEAQRINSDAVFLVLMTVFMENIEPDIFIVNNTENVASLGRQFIGCPFKLTLPEDTDQVLTSPCSIEIDNVDPRIWQGLRSLGFSPRVDIEVILSDEPDTILIKTEGLRLRQASATITTISASLIADSIWQQGYPQDDFDPRQNQGMFT